MSTPLATFFTRIGFDIDSASLKRLEAQLGKLRTQVEKTAAKQYADMRQLANYQNREHNLRGSNLRQLANYENREFNLRARRVTREAASEARRLQEWFTQRQREQSVESRTSQLRDARRRRTERATEAARLRTARETSRQAAREMRDTRQLADFQNREFNLRQRNSDRAERQRQREQRRERSEMNGLHSDAIRENIRRMAGRARRMRAEADFLNREFNLRRRNSERERLRSDREQQRQDRLRNRPPPDNRSHRGNGMMGMGINPQTALTAVAAGSTVQSLFQMANFSASQPVQYEFITGSKEKAGEQIAYVNKLTDELSLNLQDADTAYKQFLGATDSTIGATKSQEIFTGVQKLGVMMGANSDQMKRGSKAIIQMLSKQKLSAEELTGQMAEAMLIPGATQVFADVLEGKNGEKGSGNVKTLFSNMQKGKYVLADIVKVLESLDDRIDPEQLKKALTTPAAGLRRLETAWQRTLIAMNSAGTFDLMVAGLDESTKAMVKLTKWVNDNKQGIKEWADEFITTFKWVLTNLPLIISYFAALQVSGWIASLNAATVACGSLSKALWGLAKRLVIIPLLVAMSAIAFLEFYDTISGQETLWTRLAEQKDKGILGWIAAITKNALDALGLLGKLAVGVFEKDKSLDRINKDAMTDSLVRTGRLSADEGEKIKSERKASYLKEQQDQMYKPLGGFLSGQKLSFMEQNSWLFSQEQMTAAKLDYSLGSPKPSNPQQTPAPSYFNMTAPITIHVANGDPATIENTMRDVLGKLAIQASANIPAFSLLK